MAPYAQDFHVIRADFRVRAVYVMNDCQIGSLTQINSALLTAITVCDTVHIRNLAPVAWIFIPYVCSKPYFVIVHEFIKLNEFRSSATVHEKFPYVEILTDNFLLVFRSFAVTIPAFAVVPFGQTFWAWL